MASKKPQKAKKTTKAKTVSKPKASKTTAVKTAKKPKTPKTPIKGMKTCERTKTKTPVAKTVKREVKKATSKPVEVRKVVGQKSVASPKKKLSPREQRIQDIKKTLMMQRNELLSEAEEALNSLPGQTIFPDMGDQASAEIDRNFMLRLRGREQRLLKKIEQAIEKIDSGAFGICDVCGEEINLKRLEARPVTTMCIFCKTEQEEEEKLRGK